MGIRTAIFLGCIAFAMAAELLDEIPPACRKQECEWCQDCKCETVTKYVRVSAENSAYTANFSVSAMRSKKDISKDLQIATRAYVEVDKYVTDAAKASAEAGKASQSIAWAIAHAFASSLCTVIPGVEIDYLGQRFPLLHKCKDCHQAFASASASASAAAEAHAHACGYATAAASAAAWARAEAKASAKAMAEANAYAVAVAIAAGYAIGNSTATAFAKVHVNCSGAFYYYNLTVVANAQAEHMLFTAADAMTEVYQKIQLSVSATAEAAVRAKAQAKAAAGAAASAHTQAQASANAVADALGACDVSP